MFRLLINAREEPLLSFKVMDDLSISTPILSSAETSYHTDISCGDHLQIFRDTVPIFDGVVTKFTKEKDSKSTSHSFKGVNSLCNLFSSKISGPKDIWTFKDVNPKGILEQACGERFIFRESFDNEENIDLESRGNLRVEKGKLQVAPIEDWIVTGTISVQSATLRATPLMSEILSCDLATDQYTGTCSLTWYLSRDDGSTWNEVIPGNRLYFSGEPEVNNALKWKLVVNIPSAVGIPTFVQSLVLDCELKEPLIRNDFREFADSYGISSVISYQCDFQNLLTVLEDVSEKCSTPPSSYTSHWQFWLEDDILKFGDFRRGKEYDLDEDKDVTLFREETSNEDLVNFLIARGESEGREKAIELIEKDDDSISTFGRREGFQVFTFCPDKGTTRTKARSLLNRKCTPERVVTLNVTPQFWNISPGDFVTVDNEKFYVVEKNLSFDGVNTSVALGVGKRKLSMSSIYEMFGTSFESLMKYRKEYTRDNIIEQTVYISNTITGTVNFTITEGPTVLQTLLSCYSTHNVAGTEFPRKTKLYVDDDEDPYLSFGYPGTETGSFAVEDLDISDALWDANQNFEKGEHKLDFIAESGSGFINVKVNMREFIGGLIK